jgi:glycosyltransferase involved in cell wall biosynthesis
MPIYVNSRFLTQSITGVQRVAIELSLRLKQLDSSIEFVCPKDVIQHDIFEKLDAKVIGKRTGHFWEQIDLPRYLAKDDLLINLCNSAPLFQKMIVAVHDLAFLQKWHTFYFRTFYKFLIPKILRSSLAVITVSNTIKKEINATYQIDLNKIHVIYPAVADSYRNYPVEATTHEKYILFIGSMDPRKNLLSILPAFDMIENKDVKLKIVGGSESVFRKINLTYNNDKVEFLGRAPDSLLPQLYSDAIAFIFPSLYEGFGIPPLEAISFGCPVIGSDIEVLHEIYGNAMLYFNPTDISSIVGAINKVCSDTEVRNNLVSEGQKIISKYSFEMSANQLYSLIKSIA